VGVLRLLAGVDEQRNHVVHWHAAQRITKQIESGVRMREELRPLNWWTELPPLLKSDLEGFVYKATYVGNCVAWFFKVTSNRFLPDGFDSAPWLYIFQQPPLYPPPDTHPLSPNYVEPGTQPPPSQGTKLDL
jgi:hypothetical protein